MVHNEMPAPITAFIAGVNAHDSDAMLAPFARNALVTDQQRDHQGTDAIRRWATSEIVGDKVTMAVIGTVEKNDFHAVTATIDGTYDKTGLPDPLVLRFGFTLGDAGITRLIVVPVV